MQTVLKRLAGVASDTLDTLNQAAMDTTSLTISDFTLQQVQQQVLTWWPRALRIVIILIAGYFLWRVLRGLVDRVSDKAMQRKRVHIKRAQTLTALLHSIVGVSVFGLVITLVLGELGLNLGPLLAAAGVLGLAIGFGAQSLIKDLFNGFFFLFEGQVRVGDVVEAAGKAGLVEAITLRTLVLRDFSGNVHVIPHGEIATVTNHTKKYSRALIEVGVAYREDPEHVLRVLKEVADEVRNHENYKNVILEDPEVFGIDSFGDSAIMYKVRFTTKPIEQWNVARFFRRKLKVRFDQENIEIPFPHRTIYWGVDRDGSAPSGRIQIDSQSDTEALPGGADQGTGEKIADRGRGEV